MEVSLPSDFLASARKKAVKIFSESMEVAGFRKGHVPENIVIEKAGEGRILEEAADILLKEHFPRIIEQEKLDVIGHPKISITKLAAGNPIEFKATVSVMPIFELPDYKKTAKDILEKEKGKEEKIDATEKEVGDVLLQIRKNKAHIDYHRAHPDEKGHEHKEMKEEDLPPLDDELAKAAGSFKNLDDLKAKVKENIVTEKKARNTERIRAMIMEALIKNVKLDLPEVLVESEIQKSMAQMKDDVERMGMKWEDYLTHTKKKEEDLRNDLRDSSENKAKIQLIFNKIAVNENISPDKDILENEVRELKKHYPEASDNNLRIYVATVLINQEVLKVLEQQ